MGGLFITLIILFGYIISKVSLLAFKTNIIGFLLTFLVIYIFTGFVTYTPDWEGYNVWIYYENGRDIFFNYLIKQLNPKDYAEIHLIFTCIYTFLLIFFINKFSNETYAIALLYIPIVYLFFTTQIRFFMGYYSTILGCYYWYVKKNKSIAILLATFGIVNHISVLLFIIIAYFLRYNISDLKKKIVVGFIIITIMYAALAGILPFLPDNLRFVNYFTSSEQESSLLGGLYTFFPALLGTILIVLYIDKKIRATPEIVNDKNFKFLYYFSIVPLIFIGIALYRQIVGHRFIIPALLFQIVLIFYVSTKYSSKKQKNKLLFYTIIFIIAYCIYLYVLPPYFGLVDFYNQRVTYMIKTNSILKNIF